jgi:thiamine-phosphate pyrophosphorylase
LAVEEVLEAGARAIQYRDKTCDYERRLEEAKRLVAVCHCFGVPLIVNDDVELARRVGADGVHIGEHDRSVSDARKVLGETAIVGVSCYHSLERALAAQSCGATYVAFGRFFPSVTKPGAPRASIDLVRRSRPVIHLPIVAIGGITSENAGPLLAAGVDLLAVVDAVFGKPDPGLATREFTKLFEPVELPNGVPGRRSDRNPERGPDLSPVSEHHAATPPPEATR